MKKTLITVLAAGMALGASAVSNAPGYPISPVPFTSVHVSGPFWGDRIEASRNVTIPLAFEKCEENERYANFDRAAHPSESYKVEGFSFDDTDVYKTIEGASYRLHNYPDKKLEIYRQCNRRYGRRSRARRLSLYRPNPEPCASSSVGRQGALDVGRKTSATNSITSVI